MGKQINEIISHGIVLATLAVLPMVWSAAATCKEVLPGKLAVGVGASPAHAIPADKGAVVSWFRDTILHPKDRKGVILSELAEAEAKTVIIKVRQDGSGEFKSINEALASAAAKGNENRVVIDIGPGLYREKVTIERPYVTLYGDPKYNPQLVYGAKLNSTPKVELPRDTATLVVKANNFIAANLLISNFAELKDDEVGLALTVSANYAAFYECEIAAKKTVINDELGNHFFKECVIYGSSTLIIGKGRSIYLGTLLNVRHYVPTSIVAGQFRQSPDDPLEGGFVFAHCWVVGDAGAKAFLGRTDLPYARVLYAYSELSDAVQPAGWLNQSGVKELNSGFFGEYKNFGAGALTGHRINRDCAETLTEADVQSLLTLDYIYAAQWLLPAPKLV